MAVALQPPFERPIPRMRGNRAYMDIKDNGSIKDTIGNHEDTTPAYG